MEGTEKTRDDLHPRDQADYEGSDCDDVDHPADRERMGRHATYPASCPENDTSCPPVGDRGYRKKSKPDPPPVDGRGLNRRHKSLSHALRPSEARTSSEGPSIQTPDIPNTTWQSSIRTGRRPGTARWTPPPEPEGEHEQDAGRRHRNERDRGTIPCPGIRARTPQTITRIPRRQSTR